MEHKQTEATITAVDEAQGIVEAIWAVMGNIDEGNDIIHPGSFTKTFNERGHQVKLLDNHRTDSVMASLGVVKELREVRRAELPQELMERYPEATGGAWGKFQFLLDTPEGKGAFTRIQKGAIRGWSFGYDAVDKDMSTVTKDGRQIPVRNLRQLKLWEVSPVLFAMNEATTTTDAKAKPTEGKPYQAIHEGDTWNVYKLDSEGEPTGKPLGKHPSEEEADAQIAALYANEEDDKAMDSAQMGKMKRMVSMMQEMIGMMSEMMGDHKPPEKARKAGRVLSARNAKRIKAAMDELHTCLMEAGLMEMPEEDGANTGPQKSDTDTPTPKAQGAGPNEDDSTRLLKLIELELEETEV